LADGREAAGQSEIGVGGIDAERSPDQRTVDVDVDAATGGLLRARRAPALAGDGLAGGWRRGSWDDARATHIEVEDGRWPWWIESRNLSRQAAHVEAPDRESFCGSSPALPVGGEDIGRRGGLISCGMA